MNFLKAQHIFRTARRWLALLAGILAVGGVHADTQPGRFLLIFETSPALKKNLPEIQQTLDILFSSSLQRELRANDDLAVWTVDQNLHTGTFPLQSWAPADAMAYSAQLKDFLGGQNFTRHASLVPVQPLLNRVMKNSEWLTVLIFCDSQSRLVGTPYDSGVNEIITNAAAKTKTAAPPFILVLRSYQGQYLGCSVNRSVPLNFPKFPPPTKPEPEPPAVVKPAPAVAPATVAPVTSLIIVGTNYSTNASALIKPLLLVPPPPPQTNLPVPNIPTPTPKIVAAPPNNPPPASNPTETIKPTPAPPPAVVPKITSPEPVAAATVVFASTNPPETVPSNTVDAAEDNSPVGGARWPAIVGGGSLVAAVGVVVWLAVRARRPRGSLITSSMQDDPRFPPRK